MRLAAIQFDIAWEDPAANFERLRPRIASAVAAGARLVVLPETYATGFSMDVARVAEPSDGPSIQFLRDQARQSGSWICGSVPERPAGEPRPYNTLVVAGPAGELERYRKIHRFTPSGESDTYGAGAQPVTLKIDDVRVSLSICYDLRFPTEYWSRATATDVYVVVASWPAARREHWRTLLRARAIENLAYVVGVNRVGSGGGLTFAGDSAIIDPAGRVLTEAAWEETTLVADINQARVRQVRTELPFLDDRERSDA